MGKQRNLHQAFVNSYSAPFEQTVDLGSQTSEGVKVEGLGREGRCIDAVRLMRLGRILSLNDATPRPRENHPVPTAAAPPYHQQILP